MKRKRQNAYKPFRKKKLNCVNLQMDKKNPSSYLWILQFHFNLLKKSIYTCRLMTKITRYLNWISVKWKRKSQTIKFLWTKYTAMVEYFIIIFFNIVFIFNSILKFKSTAKWHGYFYSIQSFSGIYWRHGIGGKVRKSMFFFSRPSDFDRLWHWYFA